MTAEQATEIIEVLERIADALEHFVENGVEISNVTYTTTEGCGVPRVRTIPFVIENL